MGEVEAPRIEFRRDVLNDLDEASRLEWILANGLGGYASSTIIGMNTRKYHGLLVASKKPPLDRKVLLSKVEEVVSIEDRFLELSTNQYGDTIHPKGYRLMDKFKLTLYPEFTFVIDGILIRKRVVLPHGRNIVVVFYSIDSGLKDAEILLRPLVNHRSIYSLNTEEKGLQLLEEEKGTRILFNEKEFLQITSNKADFSRDGSSWYRNFLYIRDAERGEDSTEQVYNPGVFTLRVKGKDDFYLAAGFCEDVGEDVDLLLREYLERKKKLMQRFFEINSKVPENDWIKWLVLNSDSFLIERHDERKSMIAGYHWFGEWGRDTFISLPGLCLSTGRYRLAKEIIRTFLTFGDDKLVPNNLPTGEGKPTYNSVDASLWLINFAYLYLRRTGDWRLVEEIWNELTTLISNYTLGSQGVKMDSDGLIAHNPGMTWMDVKINDRYVTPREGKAVEVQALWYNALKVMEFLASHLMKEESCEYRKMAQKAKKSFLEGFWTGSYLKDTINDSTVRPNQLIALDLPFRILDEEAEEDVLKVIEDTLLSEEGIRTLPRDHPDFRGRYQGDVRERDEAYHQGTIWPWLLGSFIRSKRRVLGSSQPVWEMLEPFMSKEILRLGLSTVSEVIDGDTPFRRGGCISQAWSVAEALRSVTEGYDRIKPR